MVIGLRVREGGSNVCVFAATRRSQVIGRYESVDGEEQMDTSTSTEPSSSSAPVQRQGRSEKRPLSYKQVLHLHQANTSLPEGFLK